ncbi:HupE/UreJ family protein [Undibacterium sp.]|uniref:HupE/UreJ family protein n=1 Tax=Undibacterium sp. TaxID=1914977 RepID=UPI003752A5FD
MKTLFLQVLLLSLLLSQYAIAHLMPAQQGSINIQKSSAFVAIALPVSALSSGDQNADGLLSPQEATLFQAAIAKQVAEKIQLFDGGQTGKLDFIQINAESNAEHVNETPSNVTDGAKFFLVLMKFSFPSDPQALSIKAEFFGKQTQERQLSIKAIRGAENEVVILRPDQTQHRFFRSAGEVVLDFVQTGIHHILSGWDHLAFLLTIIAVVASWRHMLLVTAAFTLAHSASFLLALAGVVQVQPQLVEPTIAASIIFMAALNLMQRQIHSNLRLFAVFCCGLLHGLGFASSLSDMGITSNHRLWSLLGFNLGIELGQLVFLGLCFGLFWLLKRICKFNPDFLLGASSTLFERWRRIFGHFFRSSLKIASYFRLIHVKTASKSASTIISNPNVNSGLKNSRTQQSFY